MPDTLDLAPYRHRVRLLRLWQGLGLGSFAGALAGCGVILAFRLHGHAAPWGWSTATILGIAAIVALANALRTVSDQDLADSLDRRGGLKNRIGSAIRLQGATKWGSLVLSDAADHLRGIKPQRLFPVRIGRLQLVAAVVLALAIGATLLGNRPVLLTAAERAKLAEADEAASQIERVLQPYEARKVDPAKEREQLRRVAEMRQLAKDLRSMKVDKEAALQKMHQMEADAKQLEAQQLPRVQEQLSAAEKLEAQATQMGDDDKEPTKALAQELAGQAAEIKEEIAKLQSEIGKTSGSEKAALESRISSLQKQLAAESRAESALGEAGTNGDSRQEKMLKDALTLQALPSEGAGIDPLAEFKRLRTELMATTQAEIVNIKERLKTAKGAEAEALKKKLAVLEAQLAKVKQQIDAMNRAVAEALKNFKQEKKSDSASPPGPQGKMLHTKFTKPMRHVLQTLKETVKKLENGDDLTQKEVDDLRKMADDMDAEASKAQKEQDDERAKTAEVLADAARQLADQAAAVLIAQNGSGGGGGAQSGLQGYGNSHQAGPGGYMPTSAERNSGQVNHLEKPAEGKGKTHESIVDPLQGSGPDSYVEVRGPASLGKRSAVPYRTVLSSYKRKAEAALDHGQIPKKHQKRVRAYFESLNGN